MTPLVLALVVSATLALLPLLTIGRFERWSDGASDDELRSLRASTESIWFLWGAVAWAATSGVGGVFLVTRGQSIGAAWLGVAALFATSIATTRYHRRRMLAVLGDRGRVPRTARYTSRAAQSHRWAATALFGYVGTTFVQYAYPDQRPDAAWLVLGAFAIAFVGGLLGFVAVRTVMYLTSDDADRPNVGS